MRKRTFVGSFMFVPALLAGCGGADSTSLAGAGAGGVGGQSLGGGSAAGGSGAAATGGSSVGGGGAGSSSAGTSSVAGDANGGMSMGAAAGEAGAGGEMSGGSAGTSGGASAGAGGTAGASGGMSGCASNADCKASGAICDVASAQCVACTGNSDCQSDTTTYGVSYICDPNQGACVVGNCLSDTACTAGQICGLSQPDTCAPCTTDAQCQGDPSYGAEKVCSAGLCVSPACGTAKTSCTLTAGNTVLAGHECCAASGGGDACVSGGCCDTSQCAGGQTCLANVCTSCDPVAFSGGSTVYFVDPTNGSDANATGSGTSGGQPANNCAFKTITRALQVIGSPTQASGAQVSVKGNDDPAVSGETFPITVPQYVVVQGATGPVTISLSAGKGGFTFVGTGSTLKNLVIEGGGASGVGVRLATAGIAATLDSVTVQDTASAAVQVTAGTLSLLSGTMIQKAGTTQNRQQGVAVGGTGTLVAKLSSGKISITNNTAQGISVGAGGSIDLEGAVTSSAGTPTSYASTIAVNGNYFAQLYINQTAATPPLNTINGVLATGSATTHGLRIFGGSKALVRNSVFVGNGLNGIYLSHTGTRAAGVSDVSNVDLGKAGDPGMNVVQGANGQLTNGGAGICVSLDPATAQTVNAEGNIFSVGDCSATAATLTRHLGACSPVGGKPDDIGFDWVTAATTTTKVVVDASKCN